MKPAGVSLPKTGIGLDRIKDVGRKPNAGTPAGGSPVKGGFDSILGGKIGTKTAPGRVPTTQAAGLKFSSHAVERMMNRGISMSPEQMKDLQTAVSKAGAKGSRETLVLMGDNAFVVSAKNNTVITAMDRNSMKGNVFTNIDSTVVL